MDIFGSETLSGYLFAWMFNIDFVSSYWLSFSLNWFRSVSGSRSNWILVFLGWSPHQSHASSPLTSAKLCFCPLLWALAAGFIRDIWLPAGLFSYLSCKRTPSKLQSQCALRFFPLAPKRFPHYSSKSASSLKRILPRARHATLKYYKDASVFVSGIIFFTLC